jgi:hypothetical protein
MKKTFCGLTARTLECTSSSVRPFGLFADVSAAISCARLSEIDSAKKEGIRHCARARRRETLSDFRPARISGSPMPEDLRACS